MHAVARLALHPLVPNIQTSWVKMGPQGAAACLQAGANDLGGTLMNESITRAAGAVHGQEMSPRSDGGADPRPSAGEPRQRTTLYGRGQPPIAITASASADEHQLRRRRSLRTPAAVRALSALEPPSDAADTIRNGEETTNGNRHLFADKGGLRWEVVKRAEELGFSHAWFYDTQLLNAEVFAAMGASAMKTSNIKLCTGVLHPVQSHRAGGRQRLATLNALAPGRIVFGASTGYTARRTLGLGPSRWRGSRSM